MSKQRDNSLEPLALSPGGFEERRSTLDCNAPQSRTRRQTLLGIGAASLGKILIDLESSPAGAQDRSRGLIINPIDYEMEDRPGLYPSGNIPINTNRIAIAHWHFFPRSIDNKNWPDDYYEFGYLSPNGERGIHRAYGGYVRNRPLPRPTITSTREDWRIVDARDEITMAKRMGIDCFQMNEAGDYSASSKTQIMISAASHFHSFKIMLSIDCDSIAILDDQKIADYFNAFRLASPVLRHSDGKLVVGCYRPEALGPSRWASIISKIGEDVFFLPTFLDIHSISCYIGLASGISVWRGNKFSDFDHDSSMNTVSDFCTANKLEFAAQVMPQDHRPRSQVYCEARGSRNLISGFNFARAKTGRYLIIGTWNDYAEGHAIQPSTQTQFGYSDLTRYYLSWWKEGSQPTIERDAFYYFYRIEQTGAAGTGALQTAPRFRLQAGSDGPYDEIEMLAFLTRPARLQINNTYLDVGPGIQRLRIPWALGTPKFQIIRRGKLVSELRGGWATRSASDYQDLLYRSGSSLRQPNTIS
jgi:hypothetical protein